MPRSSRRMRHAAAAIVTGVLATAAAWADCPPQDLTVVLNTGWDQSTGGAVIAAGGTDEDWNVVGFDPSGGTPPYDAGVIAPHPAWLTLPDSQWIAADKYGPNGTYTYETCWCMDDDAANPNLSFAIRADDRADVYLNGTLVLALPNGTFNDATAIGISVVNPALFAVGRNCVTVEVDNIYGVVTGFDLTGTVTADDGLCCGCAETDIVDDASTGVDDLTSNMIVSGSDDDEWVVTGAASGGVLPRPAGVIDTFSGWNVIPGTQWISADENGPNGLYTYEKCWCMNPGFEDAQLDMQLLADDRADVFLNGTLIGQTPASTAFLFPATSIVTSDQDLFQGGENCVTIEVTNVSSVVTGLDVSMTITATNAACCPCAELPAGAEGWWPLDETIGPTATDLLNGHDGTWLELIPTLPPPTPSVGMVDGALTLDGVDDYVQVPDDAGLDFGAGQDFSFDAWIKTDTAVRQSIIRKKKPPLPWEPGYGFMTAGTLNLEISDGTNFNFCIGSIDVADGEWHFVAATVDRDLPLGIRLYVDGVIDEECDPTTVPGSLDNADQLYFGADPLNFSNARKWWKGELDEIEIFRRALTIADVQAIYLAGHTGKCPLEDCEDSTGIPVCEGACPPGSTCVTGNPPNPSCTCVPDNAACEGSGPVCDGPCPDPGDVCTEVSGSCSCEPGPVCEGMTAFPECDAPCPPGLTCESNGQRCHCVAANPCELSSPTCDGVCPVAGISCLRDFSTGECYCPIDPPLCEGFATYPACDGVCVNPDDVCVNNGQRCHCEPAPHCNGPGDYPTCDDACPAGYVCQDIGNACGCVEEVVPCGDTVYPACDGACPVGEICENIVGTNICACQTEPVACGDPLYPVCDGACPANQVCKPAVNQGCSCFVCGTAVPFDPSGPIVVNWSSGHKIRWTPVTCALVYNVYLGVGPGLRDQNADGLADDYGSCHIGDVIGTEVEDTNDPQAGVIHWYLVTAENFAGEGPLGENSSGQPRQATGVCP